MACLVSIRKFSIQIKLESMQLGSACNGIAQFVQSRVMLTIHLETGEFQKMYELCKSILLIMNSGCELVLNKPQNFDR